MGYRGKNRAISSNNEQADRVKKEEGIDKAEVDLSEKPKEAPHSVSRRTFLKGAAALTGALSLGGKELIAQTELVLPEPSASGIEHIVVVMMENRSFDHYFGWLPGADGQQEELTYIDRNGVPHTTYPLAPDFQGCGHPDPDHSYEGGRVEYNNGACDGWLRAGDNDIYSIGYYRRSDLAFHGKMAQRWTAFDRYFSAIMAETFPNRIYQHSAQTDRIHNSLDISTLPTIWDRLIEGGVTGNYYFSDVPFLALWGTKYLPISFPIAKFFVDCATGQLPNVSYVEPRFLGEENGITNDDHPFADIRNGQAFLDRIYKAITLSPAWSKTVLVINYDEWGGFFDHVPPPTAPIPPADQAAGNADGLLGFRVPCLLISPWSQRSLVSHNQYDHTSILKMIEWRWNLNPLTIRDSSANNIAEALNFGQLNLRSPQFSVPQGIFGTPCLPEVLIKSDWRNLLAMARGLGWPI
jgi:phospholipase C